MTVQNKMVVGVCVWLVSFVVTGDIEAQTGKEAVSLPDAPLSHLIVQLERTAAATQAPVESSKESSQVSAHQDLPSTAASGQGGATQRAEQDTGSREKLSRSQAEQMAIEGNPQITVARLLALAQHQIYRETTAGELPTANVALTAMDAEDGSRISAGSLTASRLFEHAGAGGSFSQLLTDFGRTRNLVASSALQEKAQKANALATQYDVQLATDQAFYNALEAQETLKVAQQNVTTRQTLQSQVNQMTINKLKSTLDLSFADVSLSQAKLLFLDAENNAESTMAALDEIIGLDHQMTFDLIDDGPDSQQPPPDVDQLIQSSLNQRPDLQATKFSQQAAIKFSHAQRDQLFPTIAALGTLGSVPIRPAQYYVANWWGGIGVNINIPIFNGFLFAAQAKESSIRAQVAAEQTRDLRDRIVRDVRTAWLAANTSCQRVSVTAELLEQANLGLKLAQTRYQMGLSSIVELSQAEYQQTDAAIGNANAKYQYKLALATLNYQLGNVP